MTKVYVTFDGLKDLEPNKHEHFAGNLQMVWKNVRDETGEELDGEHYTNLYKNGILSKMSLRKGNRYVITCKEISNKKIMYPSNICHTNKNPKCGLMRNVGGDVTFIKGKFKGKWVSKLSDDEIEELNNYLLWVGRKTNNEATITNVLKVLKKINE